MEHNIDEKGSWLRKEQLACVGILKQFDKVCRDNGIQYFLGYGTLLGAIREGGVIPWDDDIDIWMPRPDMERFLVSCIDLMKPYQVKFFWSNDVNARTLRPQPSIEDPTFKVGVNFGGHITEKYASIDLIALDGMPTNQLAQKLRCLKFRIWYAIIGFARSSLRGAHNPQTARGIKKIGIDLNEKLKLGKLLDTEKCLNAFEKIKRKRSYDGSVFVIGATTSYTDKVVFNKKWIAGSREMDFEGDKYPVPVEAEKVLTQIYGDYMTPPDKTKRTLRHISAIEETDKITGIQ